MIFHNTGLFMKWLKFPRLYLFLTKTFLIFVYIITITLKNMKAKTIKYQQILKQQYKKGTISRYKYYKELDWIKEFNKTRFSVS